MAQLVLSGALVVVSGRAVLEQAAWIAPARWAYAAAAASTDLNRATLRPPDFRTDPVYEPSASQWLQDMGALTLLMLVLFAAGLLLVRRSAKPAVH